jgi:hypothetical protein
MADRRQRRQRSVELLHDGFAPEPLIDLTDAALAHLDWREEALRHGRESNGRNRKHFWNRSPQPVSRS